MLPQFDMYPPRSEISAMTLRTIDTRRRQVLGGVLASGSFSGLMSCASNLNRHQPDGALLEEIAWRLLAHEPERATSLGVDIGVHAALRGRAKDSSPAGLAAYASTLRADLARVRDLDLSKFDATTRTSYEVIASAYSSALEGFALPYGDVAVGSWRNAPYVIIQNVGAYLDAPRFLDSVQPVRDAADAEAYLSRLAACPAVLNGELERLHLAATRGLIAVDTDRGCIRRRYGGFAGAAHARKRHDR
jgi:uncharacterized protein (DUF885 family)